MCVYVCVCCVCGCLLCCVSARVQIHLSGESIGEKTERGNKDSTFARIAAWVWATAVEKIVLLVFAMLHIALRT